MDITHFRGVPCWFGVFPDCPSASAVAARLQGQASHEIAHPSGRPWLVGCWPGDALVVGEAGQVKIAVVGQHAVTAGQLATAAARTHDVADLDRFARSVDGSFHLIASLAGEVRVQGTVSRLRRVFHARIGGAAVAADRADVLAEMLDAAPDPQRLAVHLLDPLVLYPLADETVWSGVRSLAADRYLVLDRDGGERSVKWWTAPDPVVAMGEGAAALRDALWAAVDVRVGGRDVVSCDLGGLDSTSVCSLAARCSDNVVAFTAEGRDPTGHDTMWARRTVGGLGNVEHHVIPDDEFPSVYDGLHEAQDDGFDEPSTVVAVRNRALFIPLQAAARGSRLHLTGFGGDELLAGSPAHLHAMLRSHPRLALRHARGFATQRPWRYRETLRQLIDRRPYRQWLARAADQLTAVPAPRDTPTLDWGMPPRMPRWATQDAVVAVRERIVAAARTAEPLAEQRGQHVELEGMRAVSRAVRHMAQMTARVGITLAAPYYDDRVLEAGLAVRPQDRITPWRYKPLIVEAMRGIVPEESLSRSTKDEGSYEVEAGLREHRDELLALCEESRLAQMGLIDADALREVCRRPLPPSMSFTALYQTLASEVWLRSREHVTISS
jgi:asparagine synthase (glutamine-hydrolysing)